MSDKKKTVQLIQDMKDKIPMSHVPRRNDGASHRPAGTPVDPTKLVPPPGPSGVSQPKPPPKK